MATLTKLESKLAEVLGLAMAAQDAAQRGARHAGSEHAALDKRLGEAARRGPRDAEALHCRWRARSRARRPRSSRRPAR